MHDWRYDPDVQHITHSDRLGTYEELQVRSGPRVMNTPTWFAASDTATVTKVPAYDTRTSTDRINELEARILQLERHADGVSKWEFESVKRRLERAEAQLHVMQESRGGAL